jgi:hypothetical protein
MNKPLIAVSVLLLGVVSYQAYNRSVPAALPAPVVVQPQPQPQPHIDIPPAEPAPKEEAVPEQQQSPDLPPGYHEEQDGDNHFVAPKPIVGHKACTGKVMELVKESPISKWTLDTLVATGKDKFFWNWIDCTDLVMSISTAVHESHHMLSANKGYQLIDHTVVPRVTGVRYAPRKMIGRDFPKDDTYVQTYLTNLASSSEEFDYLLDELNAYSVDTQVSLELKNHLVPGTGYRDGLSALMSFVMDYAKKSGALTKSQLIAARPELEALWKQAESQYTKSCAVPGFASGDEVFVDFLAKKDNWKGLEAVLGRKLNLPPSCTPASQGPDQVTMQ